MSGSPDQIAVIGLGCRFPGADNLREFWRVLVKGENHVIEVPRDRWNVDDVFSTDQDAPGKTYVKKAGFIKNYAHFDNKLFGINESEAGQMDPQQRQVLECTYMALENAGITKQEVSGQPVGVFIGCMNSDFSLRMSSQSHTMDNYTVAGISASLVSNRVSYVFHLTGPSMTIDTACSSSLVAIHQAANAIRSGDCNMAICGGVNMMLHPSVFIPLSKARMLSPSGQCHAFSSNADGYTRGEGCGIVIIKPLAQALKDKDNIWGTIVTGINQDGRAAQPITAPSSSQQGKLLDSVYTKHKIDPSTVDYIEAHGTGTKRGDPVEIGTFGEFFSRKGVSKERYLGSVKTNIGHLESAAGVAGLIKVLLMMHHDTIVPSLHFDKPNEDIDFNRFQFVVPTKSISWTSPNKVACLNSFGFGGANSHAVVTKYTRPSVKVSDTEHTVIVPFSSSTSLALSKCLQDFLASQIDLYDLRSIAYTASVKREHFPVRKAFVVKSKAALREQIEEFLLKGHVQNTISGKRRVIFVFCGMGTAWEGMCKEQLQICKDFALTLKQIDKSLKRFVSWSLTERLEKCFDVKDPEFGPIAIFACQVALAKLWGFWGVAPTAVIGQSVGEVAAAHIAGVLPLDEAVKVIYHRTKLLTKATGGKMLLVRRLEVAEVEKVCDRYTGRANTALYYSPTSCTVSGDSDAVDEIRMELQEQYSSQGTLLTELPVTSAFHSHHMDNCKKELDSKLKDLKTQQPSTQWISTVDVDMDATDQTLATYWSLNLREPVQFGKAIQNAAVEDNLNIFIEIGPKPVLQAHMDDNFKLTGLTTVCVPSLKANGSHDDLQKSLASAYELNMTLNWASIFPDKVMPTPIPRHAFSHRALTVLSETLGEAAVGSVGSTLRHLYVQKTQSESKCKLIIAPSTLGTVYEHKIKGTIVVPGATYAEAGFGILQVLNIASPYSVSVSVGFSQPVILTSGHPSNLSLDLTFPEGSSFKHELMFIVRNGEKIHAEGRILKTRSFRTEERVDLRSIQDRCKEEVSREVVYQTLALSGLTYGDSFATIDYAFRGKGESLAKLKLSLLLRKEMEHTVIHPAILDGMLQAAAATEFEEKEFLPTELKDVTVARQVEEHMYVHTSIIDKSDSHNSFTLTLLSSDGSVIASVGQFTIKYIGEQQFDERAITFRPSMKPVGKILNEEEVNPNMKVFADVDPGFLNLPWEIISFNQIKQNGHKVDIDSVLQDTNKICFIFPISHVNTHRGDPLQDELLKRIMPLRQIMLHLANKGSSVPLLIVIETREPDTSTDSRSAALCLREAIKGFVRCVLREHRSLKIQMIDFWAEEDEEFKADLLNVLSNVTSDRFSQYPEITYKRASLYAQEILPFSIVAPLYRKSTYSNGTNAVLCSQSESSVFAPFFIPSDDSTAVLRKEDVAFEVSVSTIHSPNLYGVTMKTTQKSSDTGLHPMLSFETTGYVSSKAGQKGHYISCFPTQVKKCVVIPRKCIIAKDTIPGYTPGLLIKLYTLWCLCDAADAASVAILYLHDTQGLAKALSIMLLSRGSKSVSLLTPNEMMSLTSCHHTTLIATIQITNDLTEKLSHSLDFRNIVCVDSITKQSTLEHLAASSTSALVNVLRPAEMFSPKTMQEAVPRMLKWIKVQTRKMEQLENLIDSNIPHDLSHDVHPINIAELLNMSEIIFREENGFDYKSLKTPSSHLFQKSASYLVVGGLTGLGWECVSYLASQGAGCIIILSRSKPKTERQSDMEMLTEKFGCNIVSTQVDVTNFDDVAKTLVKIRRLFPSHPVKGVFFGAAVLADSSLVDMTEDMFARVTCPKVVGTWNLHVLLADVPLDFFVMHSSVASLIGNAGQSNYGAGNGFMDGLAICRQNCRLNGQAINWGPLNLGMLDNNKYLLKRLEAKGSLPIDKKNIGQCLKHAVMLNEPQILLCRIDRHKMAEQLRRDDEKALLVRLQVYLEPVFRILDEKRGRSTSESTLLNFDNFRDLPPAEKPKMVKEYLKHLICEKALLDENTFDVNESLRDLGVDSMYAMEISGQILAETKIKLSANELQLGTVTSISAFIVESLSSTVANDQNLQDERLIISKQTIIDSIEKPVFTQVLGGKRDLVTISTIKVPDVADANILMNMAKETISRHVTARTAYREPGNYSSRDILTVDQALDFRIVSESQEELLMLYTDEVLNTKSNGPLRFIYIEDKSQLRLILHRVAFDFQGITLMIKEFQKFAEALSNGLSMDEIPREPDMDAAEEIQKTLGHSYDKLKLFWKQRLQHICCSSLTQPVSDRGSGTAEICLQEMIDSQTYTRMLNFTKENHITLFQFLSSAFQLLLAFVSHTTASTVLVPVDLRIHVPSLARFVGRCTNYIPLIADVSDNEMTVEDFLLKNRASTEGFIKYGLFPFREIQELLSEEQTMHLHRNYFIFEDDIVTNQQHVNADVDISISFGPYTESYMFVWHRKNIGTLEIKLYLKKELFTQTWSRQLLEHFKDIISQMLNHPAMTLSKLKQKLNEKAKINGNQRTSKKKASSSVCTLM